MNACHQSVENFLYSYLLFRYTNIKTWFMCCFLLMWNMISLGKGRTQTEDVWKQIVKRIFESRKWVEIWENCIIRFFFKCTLEQILIGLSDWYEMDGARSTHGRKWQCSMLVEEHQGRNHAEYSGINGKMILR